ncbi:MAG: methionyl-tRNA formyltransferase, partial [Deltaproteobacteria bacterium]
MKLIFLGGTYFSEKMLEALFDAKADIRAVFSIPQKFEIRTKTHSKTTEYINTNYADLDSMARERGIPSYIVNGGSNSLERYRGVFEEIKPDIILVLGWYYIISQTIRSLAKVATLGIHASLLPKYAGGSPLVWALMNGEKETGVTLFRMDDGIDTGDILKQKSIPISFEDDIQSLYEKVIFESRNLLISGLSELASGTAQFIPQDKKQGVPFPIRKPEDGAIDWTQSSNQIYNFVRAQTRPYPCAFSFFNQKKVKLTHDTSDLSKGVFVFEIFISDESRGINQ